MGEAPTASCDQRSPCHLNERARCADTRRSRIFKVAHEAGYLCEYVNFLRIEWSEGLGTNADGPGRRVYLRDEQPHGFCSTLYPGTQEELHAGLVIIVPNVPPAQQRALFQAALSHIAGRDLIKRPAGSGY